MRFHLAPCHMVIAVLEQECLLMDIYGILIKSHFLDWIFLMNLVHMGFRSTLNHRFNLHPSAHLTHTHTLYPNGL